MRMKLLGGASAYAHLAGLIPTRGRRAEEEDKDEKTTRRSRRSEDDDEDKDASAEDDPDQYPNDNDDKPQGRRSRAEDDDGDDDDRAEDEDEDEKQTRRSRRSRAEEDEDEEHAEDDDKDEMTGKSATARARARERARCKAIFSHPVAADNVALAASLAFDTTMTRQEAIAVLKGQQGRGGDRRDDRGARRRAGNPDLGPSAETRPSTTQANSASWDRAMEKAGVKQRGK